MKNSIIYISLFIALWGLCSCSMEEQYAPVSNESTIQLVPRITSFNGVDVATKADGDAPAFETAIYTAYLLIFDNKGNRVHFSSVAEENGSWSQKVTMKNLPSGTACFIANVPQDFAGGIDTIDELNNAVLDLTYATYTEAGGYLGVPKLTVNGESKLCIPMFGSTPVGTMTHNQTLSIPVKRLFAKISVELKLDMNLSGLQSTIQTLTNYELSYFNLHNLHNKVRLVANPNSESSWKDGSANPTTFQSASIGAKIYNSTSSMEQKSYSFDCYVPEFYLNPKQNPTDDQRYKPLNYVEGTYPIYLELVGQYNAYAIAPRDINYKVYLGNDNVSNFSLTRNTHYKNVLTIKGTDQNSTTQNNLDHRVTTSTINNPVAKAGQSANCYIIAKPGEYTIPAYKGAYSNLNEATFCMQGKNLSEYETRVEVLANVVEYESITSITFSKSPTYNPETNTISFTVNPMLNNNWVPNGSVIMALQYRKKGETQWTTEWSWHLWFVYNITASEDGWGTIGYQTMPDGTTNMMDRNLGVHANAAATPGSKVGFYYKYGQHAPYLDPDGDGVYTQYGGGSVSNATPVWNSSKSVTDPCPPGYKMPNSSVWTRTDGTDATLVDAFIYWNSGTNYIYYPYSGYVGSNLQLQKFSPTQRHTGYHEAEMTFTAFGTGYGVRKINYYIDVNKDGGALWGTDKIYKYDLFNAGLLPDIMIADLEYATKTWFGWSEWRKIDGTSDIVNGLLTQVRSELQKEESVKNVLKDFVGLSAINSSHAYQVRCVMEKEE